MTVPFGDVVHGDCLTVMSSWPDESVDLVVTSPPYNLKNTSGGGFSGKGTWTRKDAEWYDSHDDALPHDEYVEWQRACLTEMVRLVGPSGAVFYNHKWRVQRGLLQDRADIVDGFPVRQVVIWDRGSGMNFNDGYFVPTYEVIYVIAGKDFRLAPKAGGTLWWARVSPWIRMNFLSLA
jgi:modification methylase